MANGIVLNIDTTKSEFQNPMIELRQGDGNYQSLDVTVTSNGSPFNLTGWTITFMGTTSGGFKIVDAASVVTNALQGQFTYTPPKAWGQNQGEFKNAYFKFTKADETASGASFRVNVLDAVDLTTEEAQDYISVVDQTINKLNGNLKTLQSSVDQLNAQNLSIKTSNNTWTGTNTFNLPIKIGMGSISSGGIELSSGIPYIDFHYNNTTADFSTRIIETTEGTLNVLNASGKGNLNANLNGNADTSSKLQTPRKINGTNFDGTADININAANDANLVHNTGTETVAGNKTFTGKIIATQLIQGGIDYTLLTGGTDFNTLTSVGKYRGGGVFPNSPVTTNYQYVLIVEVQGDFISQTAIRFAGGKSFLYFRTYVLSTWSPWTILNNDDTVVHSTGTETINGDKTFRSGNYGLRVTTTGIQKTSDNGVTWTNI